MRRYWQAQGKRAARAGICDRFDLAAVSMRHGFRQTESETVVRQMAATIAAIETFEKVRQFFLRNARPGITNGDFHPFRVPAQRYLDATANW